MNRLVEEKSENTGTAAKAGFFWLFLTVPLLFWRRMRRRKRWRR